MGPLGGLNAALHYAGAHGYAGVLSLGCDMPLLPDYVARALIGNDAAIVQGQHLVGYWPAILADDLAEHLLSCENRSIRGWLDRIRPRAVFLTEAPLPNINTPFDLEALRQNWPRR
jgi:molybdopterin-guanine dinucleotide biosynthesis protein A